MINKLRRRFILITMSSVTLVIVLLSLSVNIINFISTNSDLSNMLEIIYENQGSVPDLPRGGKPNGMRDIPITPETPYSTRYFVIHYNNEDGRLRDADMRHIAAVTEDDVEAYLSIALRHGDGFGFVGSYKYYVVTVDSGESTAIFLECQKELHSVRMFALASVLVSVVGIVLVYILVMFFSKRAIDPVVKSAEKQKQFITDASHELKTPLTVITTSLKVLEMEVGEQKWISKAQAQTEKMSELVNDLVVLSRLDEEKPALRLADFDISEAVTETAESFRDFAAARGHALKLEIPPGLTYRGDEYAVRQLVSILLDNAVKYSDEGGEIRLSLERSKRGVILKARNACTGMDPAELDRLFDRFYRVEKSRSKQTGGFGVGLSIARSIAEAHKGSIKAECPDKHTIQFVVILK
ncbi:MAG: sensor histidine kinase [Oscillospiraceae bacterium]